jgi:rubrerythrin
MDKRTLDTLLAAAIVRELESNAFYGEVAERSKNPNVKQIFAELAAEELGHRDVLEKVRLDPKALERFAAPKADYKVAEATEMPPLSIYMKPADAIALAMKKEQQSIDFYSGLASSASDAEMRKVFERLADMERSHKVRLETVFVQIGYPEAF